MSLRRSSTLLLLPLTLLLSASCSDAGEQSEPSTADGGPPPVTGPVERLASDQLAGLDSASVVIALPWSTNALSRDPDRGAARATVADTRAEAHEAFDRFVFEFLDDAPFPGYRVARVDSVATPCASDATIPVEGPALLLRIEPVEVEGLSLSAPDGASVVEGLESACRELPVRSWLLRVPADARARVVELREPTRLVVDVSRGETSVRTPSAADSATAG